MMDENEVKQDAVEGTDVTEGGEATPAAEDADAVAAPAVEEDEEDAIGGDEAAA